MPDNNSEGQPPETEMLDVIVTLDVSAPQEIPPVLAELKGLGLGIVKVDEQNGVVEGSIEAGRLAALRRVHRVRYVRPRFEYMAKPPAPRPAGDAGKADAT
jgi:hypothetical protein